MASLHILCCNPFRGPSKFLKNISWPIKLCLKYFMASIKTFRTTPPPPPPPPPTHHTPPPPSYILNVRSLSKKHYVNNYFWNPFWCYKDSLYVPALWTFLEKKNSKLSKLKIWASICAIWKILYFISHHIHWLDQFACDKFKRFSGAINKNCTWWNTVFTFQNGRRYRFPCIHHIDMCYFRIFSFSIFSL